MKQYEKEGQITPFSLSTQKKHRSARLGIDRNVTCDCSYSSITYRVQLHGQTKRRFYP